MDIRIERHHAHELIDRLPDAQLASLVSFLETIVEPGTPREDEPISVEEAGAVAASKEWFQTHEGVPFEEVVNDLGFTMDEILGRQERT